jgi:hypothetical protein
VVHGSLKAAEGDLELFNREKQQKLNELDVVVPLRLHQVRREVSLSFWVSQLSCLNSWHPFPLSFPRLLKTSKRREERI